MPRLPDDRLNVAVYFYPTVEDAKNGTESGGTGFWARHPFPDISERELLCIVTNKHVAQTCNAVRLNRNDGALPDCIEIEARDVFPHRGNHDVAIIFVPIDAQQTTYNAVPSKLFITKEIIAEFDIGIGDDTYLIGRFVGHEGRVHNEPTARFGNVSAMNRPMFNAEMHIEEDSFAVETRSKPGYSGSPVFVRGSRQIGITQFKDFPQTKGFEYLLGVLWGQIAEKRPLRDKDGVAIPGPHVTEASGLSGVVPAWHLLSLFEQDEVRTRIDEIQDDVKKQLTSTPSSNSASGPAS